MGGNSLLKISRNLYSLTFTSGKGGGILNAGGYSTNNYANGLEITSYLPSILSTAPGANRSVAIAVGTVSQIAPAIDGNTTGFFVSDTGQNISIGQYIDDTAAIGVSGAGTDHAIKAKGNIGVTGNVGVTGALNVVGNLGVTGDTTLRTGTVTIYDTSASTADFTFSGGKINNTTKTLHHNPTTDPPGGEVYISPGSEVVSSGNFSYNSNGPLSGTWTKVGQVITVMGSFTPNVGTDNFRLPVQPSGGSVISNVNGVANSGGATVKPCKIIQNGATNARLYQDGNPPPAQSHGFSLQYLIS